MDRDPSEMLLLEMRDTKDTAREIGGSHGSHGAAAGRAAGGARQGNGRAGRLSAPVGRPCYHPSALPGSHP